MPSGMMTFRNEPFRLFFPLGYLFAILGLGIWVLDYLDPGLAYPGGGHAVLMMQGFAFSFSLGIILTELPKSFGAVDPPPFIHLVLMTCFLLAMAAAALARSIGLSQIFFFLASLNAAIYLALSWGRKKHPQRADFVFTAGAMLSALAGSMGWILSEAGYLPGSVLRWGQLAVFQAFFILFAFGTFQWEPQVRQFPGSRRGRPGIMNGLVVMTLLGILGVEAFAADLYPERTGLVLGLAYGAKAALVFWFLLARVKPTSFAAFGSARLALFLCLFGLMLPILFPGQSVAVSHVTYVAGFSWFVIARATTLVALRHSFLLPFSGWGTVAAYGSLLLTGGILRAMADFFPEGRAVILLVAVIFVLVPIIMWSYLFFPYVEEGGRHRPKWRRSGLGGVSKPR